jgi:hypothetical protein
MRRRSLHGRWTVRALSTVSVSAVTVVLFSATLHAQAEGGPKFRVEAGAEWTTSAGFDGPGVNLGLGFRPTARRWELAGGFSWLGSGETHGQVPNPTAGLLDVVTETSDQLGFIGARVAAYEGNAGPVRMGLSLGISAAVRRVTSITTKYDSTGALHSRDDHSSTLWGPRGEALAAVTWRLGRKFWIGASGGPTFTLGAGAGEDGELGAGALVTWLLRGQIGF